MKNNVINFTGIQTPRYRAQRIRQDRDQDLFVDLLARHPGHIARAKAKREAYVKAQAREAAAEEARLEAQERTLTIVGHIAVFALLAMILAWAL